MKEQFVEEDEGHTSSTTTKKVDAIDPEKWLEISDTLKGESWAAFAIFGRRDSAIPAGHVESVKPPSREAFQRLEQAYDKTTLVLRNIRDYCRKLTKDANEKTSSGKAVSPTLSETVAKGAQMCDEMDVKIATFSKFLLADSQNTTDAAIKASLKDAAPLCASLVSLENDLIGLMKANNIKTRAPSKKEK